MTYTIDTRYWSDSTGAVYVEYQSSKNPLTGNYASGSFRTTSKYGVPDIVEGIFLIDRTQVFEAVIIKVCRYLNINKWDIAGYENLNPATIAEQERQAAELANSITQAAIDEANKTAGQIALMGDMLTSSSATWASPTAFNQAENTYSDVVDDYNLRVPVINAMPSYEVPATSEIDNTQDSGGQTAADSNTTYFILIPIAIILFFVIAAKGALKW